MSFVKFTQANPAKSAIWVRAAHVVTVANVPTGARIETLSPNGGPHGAFTVAETGETVVEALSAQLKDEAAGG
jgi:hypothetical protein